MVGFVAENAISPLITVEEIRSRNLESTILLDVRSKEEFNNGHIPGAVHIPVDELRGRLN
ncbi:rhodanese-like domain-containing protein [Paenibacillus silvae]|uniref:rhodanese-like domain-containing protein n=1 Tax=Paenibacillus silvae TaxID=1325358 RepID=UPI0025A309A0|nr:rhodanese-like domain-containing protein [Paenibacillus silvae]MDM5277432.1 rhodanese-like domain-containing protein [Paenibacillus silvae]